MSEYAEITAKIKRQTDEAILINDGDIDVWLPLSKCRDEDGSDLDTTYIEHCITTGFKQVILMPEWLAIEKGLI